MCERAERRLSPGLIVLVALAWALLASSVGAWGQEEEAVTVELSGPAERTALELRQGWNSWLEAVDANQPEIARSASDQILATARKLGANRLPDFAAGAVVVAAELIEEGEILRAGWILEEAERFASDLPAVSFAQARLAAKNDDWLGRLRHESIGYLAWLQVPGKSGWLLRSLVAWLIASVLVAALFFLVLMMATKGPALVADLRRAMAGRLPEPVAFVLTLVFLLWPLAFPAGLFWLACYWAVLLWGYGSVSERVWMLVLWLAIGCGTLGLGFLREASELEFSPAVRVVDALERRELYGDLFTDFDHLARELGPEPMMFHLAGDLDRRLGQWESARRYYDLVIEAEPKNVTVLVNLGAYHYLRGDIGTAIRFFKQAAQADDSVAAVFFNLNKTYNDTYQFDESREAMSKARSLDEEAVAAWLRQPPNEPLAVLDGGVARHDEVREALVQRRRAPLPANWLDRLMGPWRPLGLALLGILLSLLLHGIRSRLGYGGPRVVKRGSLRRLLDFLVPGLAMAQDGAGSRAFLFVWIPTIFALLPAMVYRLWPPSWQFDPGPLLLYLIAGAGLLLFAIFHTLRVRREEL